MNLNAAVRIKVSKSVSFSGDPKDHQIHRTLRKKIDFNFFIFLAFDSNDIGCM